MGCGGCADYLRDDMRKSPVLCNGCTLCCHNDAIRILPGDDVSLYQVVPHERLPNTHLMLDHKANGDCIYLGDTGCMIHGHKPRMCREMDCRNLARAIGKKQAKRDGILQIWNKGRTMA